MSEWTERQVAEAADAFAKSEFGERFLSALSLQYNGWHQDAESEQLTSEQKAMKVERAAGVKWAIDYVTTRQMLLKTKAYEDEPTA